MFCMKKDGGYYITVSLLMTLSCFRKNLEQSSSLIHAEDHDSHHREETRLEEQDPDNNLQVQVAVESWKNRFYEIYNPTFQKMKNSTLTTEQKYNEVVQVLQDLESQSKMQQKNKERKGPS